MDQKILKPVPRWFERYMLLVGVFGNLIFYFQAYEIFTRASAKDVSVKAFAVGLWAVSSWLVYGLFLRNRILIVANVVAVIGATLVLIGIAIYR